MSKLYGDWEKLERALNNLVTRLMPVARAYMNDKGEIVLEKIKEHISNQDLDWSPLAESTIRIKNGNDTIYVDTGFLKENIKVTQLKSSSKDYSIFIGADPDSTYPDGTKLSDVIVWLEYGTTSMPARPLIRPTFEEIKDEFQDWKDIIKEAMEV